MPLRNRRGEALLPKKFPGSGGPPPKPKPPKDPARDSPSDPGHGTPVPPPKQPKPNPNPVHDSPSDPGHGTSPTTGNPYKPSPAIIRRQKLLRRAGYNIAVDGLWGAASQAAWAKFTGQIARAGSAPLPTPPGMVNVGGVLVSKEQAGALRAIERAETSVAKSFHESKMDQLVRQASHDAQRIRSLSESAFHALAANEQPAPGTPPQLIARAQQKLANRQIRQQYSHVLDDTVTRIAGVDDTFVKGNPDWLEIRARQGRVTVHDLGTLIHHDWLDFQDASDVRAIQNTINRQTKEHVDVTGTYDPDTAHALESAWAKQMAADWQSAVGKTRSMFYRTDIAPGVLTRLLGHDLTPEQLTALLRRGGPTARKVGVALGRQLELWKRDQVLQHLRTDQANVMGASTLPFLTKGQRELDQYFALSRVTDRRQTAYNYVLRDAKTLGQFSRQAAHVAHYLDELERKEYEQKANDHEWWQTGLSAAVTGLEALNWAGSKVRENVYALNSEVEAVARGWGYTDIYGLAAIPERGPRGFISWHEAMIQGRARYDNLDWVQRLSVDIVTDPFTYIGVGLVARTTSKGLLLSSRYARGAIDLVGEWEPVAGGIEGRLARESLRFYADTAEKIGRGRFYLAPKGWAGARLEQYLPGVPRTLAKLTAQKAAVVRDVKMQTRAAFAAALRPGVETKLFGEIAARLSDDPLQNALDVSTFLDTEVLADVQRVGAEHADALYGVAPEFVAALGNVPTSLYAREGRLDAELSYFGRTVEARLKDAHSRHVTARLAILKALGEQAGNAETDYEILSDLPLGVLRARFVAEKGQRQLDRLLKETGGHGAAVDFDFAEQLAVEQRQFNEWLHNQILPALDAKLLELHGPDLFNPETRLLVNEAGDDIRQAVDEFWGVDVKAGYETKVTVTNPNYKRIFTAADKAKIQQAETEAVRRSATSYADMQVRLGPSPDFTGAAEEWEKHWTFWATDQWRESVVKSRVGWTKLKSGKWRDDRRLVEVPLIHARGWELSHSTAAHRSAADIAEAVGDAGRTVGAAGRVGVRWNAETQTVETVPLSMFDAARFGGHNVLAGEAVQGEMRRLMASDGNQWWRFANTTLIYQAKQSIAEDQIARKLYRDNLLMWQAMKHSQHQITRAVYYGVQAELAVWKAGVLAFRPAFFFRNWVDNWSKAFIAGLNDPRLFFNSQGKSIFEVAGVREMRAMTRYFDGHFDTEMLQRLDGLLDGFWQQDTELLQKILGAHGLESDAEYLEGMRRIGALGTVDKQFDLGESAAGRPIHEVADPLRPSFTQMTERLGEPSEFSVAMHDFSDITGLSLAGRGLKKATDVLYDLMASRPENFAKRALYTSRFRQVLAETGDPTRAMQEAIDTVYKTLFDYDSITVLEELIKPLIPFVFFWRKNAGFWARTAWNKPWFVVPAVRFLDAHADSNDDEPEWMRRYFSLEPLANVADKLGFSWAADHLQDAKFDPVSLSSVSAFYRAFKSDNPDLPADEQGSWRFVSQLVDNLNGYLGVGFNPLMTDPLARLGYLNRRGWQDIFPQTQVLEALTNTSFLRDALGVDSAQGFNLEDWLLDPIFAQVGSTPGSELSLQAFNVYVKQELAEQAYRGEEPNLAAAEKKVRGMIVFRNLMGFAVGIFPRTISAQEVGLNKMRERFTDGMSDAEFKQYYYGLTEDQQLAYKLFKEKNDASVSPRALVEQAVLLQGAQAYYRIEDYDERQEWLGRHPDVAAFVDPTLNGSMPSEQWLRNLVVATDTQSVMDYTGKFLHGIDANYDVVNSAYQHLVTPSLTRFWAENDTPSDRRYRHAVGQYAHYIDHVDRTYRAIPDTDYEARAGFLERHPYLQDWWSMNDSATDDFTSVMYAANSSFRTVYFDLVNREGFSAADDFLRTHSFMFDFTSAEGRVDTTGKWQPKSEWQKDYQAVAELERVYYALPKSARKRYLDAHPSLGRFYAKYGAAGTPLGSHGPQQAGGLSQHAKDYLAIKPLLDAFFALPDGPAKERYLEAHPALRGYFAKYAHERTTSAHARAYLAIKPILDQFFALPEDKRQAFLERHPELQAYFDEWGDKGNHVTIRESLAANPDIAARYHFWMRFFALPPDERAEFVHKHAAKAGVFIYGSLSYDARQLDQARWHRQAMAAGQSDRAFLFLKVKPLLDIYFKLPKGGAERAVFLTVNPELKLYLDRYTSSTVIKDPTIRALAERYFALDPFTQSRSDFLNENPALRDYFNRNPSPREAVIQRQLDAYFALPFESRDEYAATHPELQHYFDQRAAEKQNFEDITASFNEADPRMKQFYEMYADIIPRDRMRLYWLRAQGKHPVTELIRSERIERQPPADQQFRRLERAGTDPTLT